MNPQVRALRHRELRSESDGLAHALRQLGAPGRMAAMPGLSSRHESTMASRNATCHVLFFGTVCAVKGFVWECTSVEGCLLAQQPKPEPQAMIRTCAIRPLPSQSS